jgi:hypothetical protein
MESLVHARPRAVPRLAFVVLALSSICLSSCGKGSRVVSHVQVESVADASGDVYARMEAVLSPGALVLPSASLPLYHPKYPSVAIGGIEMDGLNVRVKLNVSEVLRLPAASSGALLPNGAPIPLNLPQGLLPISVPVFNSNSAVYFAVKGKQILLGVAISIAKEDRLNLPLGIFLPFTVSSEVHGTAGFFLGERQGLGVFALRESPEQTPLLTGLQLAAQAPLRDALSSSPGFSILGDFGGRAPASLPIEDDGARIEVREERITNSQVRRLQRTWDGLRSVRLD